MQGQFITFEGTEGCGKSTQIKMLVDRLQKEGRNTLLLREPGGTVLGERLRHIIKHDPEIGSLSPIAELLLLNASRAQLVEHVIRPALAQGQIVVCDRFYDSTTAYQQYGRELPGSVVAHTILAAVGETQPNLTLLLRLPREKALDRVKKRDAQTGAPAPDRFEKEKEAFFLRVENGYTQIANGNPMRVKTIDADGTPEEVHERIWQQVQKALS